MASIKEVITELERLTPDQVDEVARVIQRLARTGCPPEVPRSPAVPAYIVDEAVQHGWPAQLFTELIGCLPDIERAAQPSPQDRIDL
jgi:hypothetical protein